jgi:release factor glutamine methyltransferase
VHLLELSGDALPYLQKNAEPYANAQVRHEDILRFCTKNLQCQLIVSNPPYIASGEIATLSKEVRREPRMALEGGEDGLDFYRAIAARWLPVLASGGMLALECGDGQAEQIAALLAMHGAQTPKILRDYHGVQRIVTARA